jgi:PAS domain S-box-containing protein
LQCIGDGVVVTDRDGRINLINPVAEKLAGRFKDECVGKLVEEVLELRDRDGNHLENPVRAALRTRQTVFLEDDTQLVMPDGKVVTIDDSAAPITAEDGRVTGAVLVFRDVTEKCEAIRLVRESQERYDALFNAAHEGIGYVDLNERITYCNPAYCEIFEESSSSELIGRSLFDYILPDQQEIILRQTETRQAGITSQYEVDIITAKGTRKTILASVSPVRDSNQKYAGAVGVILDITASRRAEKLLLEYQQELESLVQVRTSELRTANESLKKEIEERQDLERQREEMQQRLHKAEKMESLGLLAGGVAHDLNNTLGPLVGYPDLMLRRIPEGDPMRKMVERIGHAAQDAAAVIQDLLTLARRGRYELRPTSLNAVVSDFLESAGYLRVQSEKSGITVQTRLNAELPPISGSSAHLSKVIGNIVFNAFDAMGDKGELIITTRCNYLPRLVTGYEEIAAGDYCALSIRDTGCGISPEDLPKIFEPYFSKKKMGRSGTGLGLAVVYGVVKDHNGYYDVISEVGKGTEFLLYFPALTDVKVISVAPAKLSSGTGNILVVDDSEEQRDLARQILAELGYAVSCADNGHRALEQFEEQPYDLVLLDMIMKPNFDGLDTYEAMLKKKPGQRAVIISGYSSTDRVRRMLDLGAFAYLKKPYTVESLATVVGDALAPKDPQREPAGVGQ